MTGQWPVPRNTKGEVLLYHWPPVWLVWNQPNHNWQFLFLFVKQINLNQSNRRSTERWYFPLKYCLAKPIAPGKHVQHGPTLVRLEGAPLPRSQKLDEAKRLAKDKRSSFFVILRQRRRKSFYHVDTRILWHFWVSRRTCNQFLNEPNHWQNLLYFIEYSDIVIDQST